MGAALEDEIADLCVAQPRFAWAVSRARFAHTDLEYRLCIKFQLDMILEALPAMFGPKSSGAADARAYSQETLDKARSIIRQLWEPPPCHPLCPCRFDLVAWAQEGDHTWRKKARRNARRANSGVPITAIKMKKEARLQSAS